MSKRCLKHFQTVYSPMQQMAGRREAWQALAAGHLPSISSSNEPPRTCAVLLPTHGWWRRRRRMLLYKHEERAREGPAAAFSLPTLPLNPCRKKPLPVRNIATAGVSGGRRSSWCVRWWVYSEESGPRTPHADRL